MLTWAIAGRFTAGSRAHGQLDPRKQHRLGSHPCTELTGEIGRAFGHRATRLGLHLLSMCVCHETPSLRAAACPPRADSPPPGLSAQETAVAFWPVLRRPRCCPAVRSATGSGSLARRRKGSSGCIGTPPGTGNAITAPYPGLLTARLADSLRQGFPGTPGRASAGRARQATGISRLVPAPAPQERWGPGCNQFRDLLPWRGGRARGEGGASHVPPGVTAPEGSPVRLAGAERQERG